MDSGSEPKDIAAQVLSAIRKEQLDILPHPEFHQAIRSHAEDLVLQRNPARVVTLAQAMSRVAAYREQNTVAIVGYSSIISGGCAARPERPYRTATVFVPVRSVVGWFRRLCCKWGRMIC